MQAAQRKRAFRPYVGTVFLSLGVVSMGTGLAFLFSHAGVAGLSQQSQFAWGAGLVGGGVPFASMGLRALLQPTVEETSWDAYRRAQPGIAAEHSITVAPIPGGAAACIQGTF
jgi:hypothetical protein